MYQRIGLPILLLLSCWLVSCSGKKNSSDKTADLPATDTTAAKQTENKILATDTTLSPLQSLIEKGFDKWVHSFKNFHIDSFRQAEKRVFLDLDYDVTDLPQFYSLYKPSLSFSPDSSQFIDLYSNGIWLEKKGKKIIAIGDADQGVTLYNGKTKKWKTIISFGPSAGMEEALWVSTAQFILAGSMQNDDGKNQPVLLVGNTEEKSFRWFEASFVRDESLNYKASGFSKLKIDEWE